jgi:queuosine precursor transporter
MTEDVYEYRREVVFLILAGVFLSAMTMLNIIGITRFVQLGPFAVAVGVLPYPLTFLCTDLLSEFYGKKRANAVVWVGLGLNVLVLGTMWLGNMLPSVPEAMRAPWQTLQIASETPLPDGSIVSGSVEFFSIIYACTAGAVIASMAAYLTAQFCDVALFHYLKKLTDGKHLWLRNNGSTIVSQLVDSFMVISITFGAAFLDGKMALATLGTLFVGTYSFKFAVALLDTIPFYGLVKFLKGYLSADTMHIP